MVFSACQQEERNQELTDNVILPFSIRIVQRDLSNPNQPEIILTEKNLRVLNHNGGDALQYQKLVHYSDTLSDISELCPFALDSAAGRR